MKERTGRKGREGVGGQRRREHIGKGGRESEEEWKTAEEAFLHLLKSVHSLLKDVAFLFKYVQPTNTTHKTVAHNGRVR